MPALPDELRSAYTTLERDGRYEICAPSGRVIMVCNDEASATHYVVMLNEAYRAGYQLGYSDGHNK